MQTLFGLTQRVLACSVLLTACGSRTTTNPSDYETAVKPQRDAAAGLLADSPPPCNSGPDCGLPTSCWVLGAGVSDCGVSQKESCCASPAVAGGTFLRSYDGVALTNQTYTATVSPFRLDRFEVTVGRFRKFLESWSGTNSSGAHAWRPASGLGKHDSLASGNGLVVGTLADGGAVYEDGWNAAWNAQLPAAPSQWTTNLTTKCLQTAGPATWTAAPSGNEELPVNCVTWLEAYAFCIWDDGFLPSETEWNFAASDGDEQREYPWTWNTVDGGTLSGADAATMDLLDAGVATCGIANFAIGSDRQSCITSPSKARAGGQFSPSGDSAFGQADLGGNVQEWVLDSAPSLDAHGPVDMYAGYQPSCSDCAIMQGARRILHGGSFADRALAAEAGRRAFAPPGQRSSTIGFRCARDPQP